MAAPQRAIWDVNRNPEAVLAQVLEAFATGICVLAVQNRSSEMLQIGPILSVHVCVCVFVCLFVCATFLQPVFGPILNRIHS